MAGVSKGTLFNYYKNKEDLFMSSLLKGYQNYFEQLTSILKLTPLKSKQAIKDFLLEEVDNLLDNYYSLVRLNALRGSIFEGKADQKVTQENHKLLYLIMKKFQMPLYTLVLEGGIPRRFSLTDH